MRIDPKLIIEFAAIAAKRLRVAQPWLSARLARLEEQIGFRLLERTTRTVFLTDRGAEFLPAARALANSAADADRMVLQLRRSSRQVLRVGAAPYTKLIPARQGLIDTFARQHPDVHIELETGWSHALMARLADGEVDVTFIMGDCWPRERERIRLANVGIAVSVARDHPWAGLASLDPALVVTQPILVFTRSLYPEVWDELYAPFIALEAAFVEVPEMAEGPPARMREPADVAAFFDFGPDDRATADVVRIPVRSSVAVPFQLMRLDAPASAVSGQFWHAAQMRANEEASAPLVGGRR